jgi:elongation factor P
MMLQKDFIGEAKDYLTEGMSVEILYVESRAVSVELPPSANLKITESPEGLRGDSSGNVMKPAILETGKSINVPLFIKEGEIIKVDTRTGAYMGRA